MPILSDNQKWKNTASDIAYKDPFSQATAGIRKKLIFFSTLIALNNYYPIDLGESHILGIKFAHGLAPPIMGLMGLITLYFSIVLVIYTYQEIKAWLAQANALELFAYQRTLGDVHAHNQSIQNAVERATVFLEQHDISTKKLIALHDSKDDFNNTTLRENIIEMSNHKESFSNFLRNMDSANQKFGSEIDKGIESLAKTVKDYKGAFFLQTIKIGLLEIALPFAVAIIALFLAMGDVITIIQRII